MPTEAEITQLLEYEGGEEDDEDIDQMDYMDEDEVGVGAGTAEEPMIH